jgi:uncharacterized protein (TIGR01244 family)
MPRLRWVFGLAVLAGIAGVVSYAAITNASRQRVDIKPLADGVWVTEQVRPDSFSEIKLRGFKSVIDLRPDGEEPGQPSSESVAKAARALGLAFAYVPVQHGDIPGKAVDALGQSLASAGKPVLLYCRSGKRAVRTWALSEASRADGPDAVAIQAAVRSAGQSADDLAESIAARIAARSNSH